MLGVSYTASVGTVREEARKQVSSLATGIAKQQFLEMQITQALVEQQGYDLLVMGRPEGPGCYCFANSVLRDVIQRLASRYRYIVVDCEAGLEHLSRRTVLDVDYLLTISDPSLRGLRTANRVGQVLEEMQTRVRHRGLIVNQVRNEAGELSKAQSDIIGEGGFESTVILPFDDSIRDLDETGPALSAFKPECLLNEKLDLFFKRLF